MRSPYASILLIAVLVLLMYFVVLRPQRKRQQAQQKTLSVMEPGARVMTTSGIYATVVHVGERQMVLDLGGNNRITVLKQAVAKVVPEGEEDAGVDAAALPADQLDAPDTTAASATSGQPVWPPAGPTATGPNPTGPNPTGPNPTGPNPTGPAATSPTGYTDERTEDSVWSQGTEQSTASSLTDDLGRDVDRTPGSGSSDAKRD